MDNKRVEAIHTVALVGHEQAGKTTLADALLFKAKAVERRGSVDEGTSVSDFDVEKPRYTFRAAVRRGSGKRRCQYVTRSGCHGFWPSRGS